MTTAISVPDRTYTAVTNRARELGMSRSASLSVAARRYLDELDRVSLTQQIDEALATVGADESGAAAVAGGQRRLQRGPHW